jgi:hypothetical protein
MRKTPEQVLTEWTTQEFTLDLGQGTKTYSANDFCRLVIALALDGQSGLEPLLKKEFENPTLRRAYTTAWERLFSIVSGMLADDAVLVLMREVFDLHQIARLSNLVDFEDYFEEIILKEFGIPDGMKLGTYAKISEDRIKWLCGRLFQPRGPMPSIKDILSVQPMTRAVGLDALIKKKFGR